MHASELRRTFIDYFVQKDHLLIPSASLIPHDQTLLFTNSGMVPFKPYFVGEEKPPHPRAVSVQKCVRAGGKHNDLDEVGRTARHLTFFEMMGNFSFGDYFKETAIPQAWDFCTNTLSLDPERLWVTVHLSDDEAADLWRDEVGVPAERIQRLDDDNWWRMADTGPNGPSSEIFWDKGEAYGPFGGPENPDAEDRYVEIWNLVFMQFETNEAGESSKLPKPSIDTGAGLERILSVLQGKDSVFEVDEMQRLINSAEAATGYHLGRDDASDLALRVLAEHSRTTTFLINDGVFPSNEDRGYVLRRIIRRAVRFAYLLGVESMVMPQLIDSVVEIMGGDYPDLKESHDLVRSVAEREEGQFRKTLATGSNILDDRLRDLPVGGDVPGPTVFLLHDTYGFPKEVTAEVAAERGFGVDMDGFETEMAQQRARAKAARKNVVHASDSEAVQELVENGDLTTFVGRDHLTEVPAQVLAVTGEPGENLSVFLDRSPFYAEAGGQIGDTGSLVLINAAGETEAEWQVTNTIYAVPGIQRHVIKVISGELQVGDEVRASIDVDRRNRIRRHHTATHLIHWALRNVLGDHVKQQGSVVEPDRLRFDFSHFEPVTAEQVVAIEDLVNAEILANPAAEHPEVTKAEAEAMGAIAFFGDKYGDLVRVLKAGPTLEFCGGTHVAALGDIGPVKITSEGSIGSNIRRIEAVAGTATVEMLRNEQAQLQAAAELLNVPVGDVTEAIRRRLDELKDSQAELKKLRGELARGLAAALALDAQDGIVITRQDGMDRNDMKDLAMAVRDQPGIRAVVLAGSPDGKGAALLAAVSRGSEDAESGLDAGAIIAEGSKAIQGGGGKGADFAMAGGKNAAGIDEALELAKAAIFGAD